MLQLGCVTWSWFMIHTCKRQSTSYVAGSLLAAWNCDSCMIHDSRFMFNDITCSERTSGTHSQYFNFCEHVVACLSAQIYAFSACCTYAYVGRLSQKSQQTHAWILCCAYIASNHDDCVQPCSPILAGSKASHSAVQGEQDSGTSLHMHNIPA